MRFFYFFLPFFKQHLGVANGKEAAAAAVALNGK